MTYAEMITNLRRGVEANREKIIALGHDLYKTPETGFREVKTMQRLLREIEDMGLSGSLQTWEGVTGYSVVLDTGRSGPTVMLMGELDSVVCFEHPFCDPETGAVPACGHHAQNTAVIGAAYALLSSGVLEQLCGKIVLHGVPAEECLQLEWRLEQIRAGRLRYMGGKAELLSRGAYDGVDIVLGTHPSDHERAGVFVTTGSNGFVSKSLTIHGKSAHAAGLPEKGVNALYAANLGLMGLNALRETFRDEDYVRVHPIMTSGGRIVNAIPEEAKVETLVRGRTMEAVMDAAEKFDRAFVGACYAMNATVTIHTQPGFLPGVHNPLLEGMALEVGRDIGCAEEDLQVIGFSKGSTDIGDLQTLLPVLQVFCGLAQGEAHGRDFLMRSDEVYLFPSLYLAAFAAKLLVDDGKMAKKIREEYKPKFHSKEEYCAFVDALFTDITLPEKK